MYQQLILIGRLGRDPEMRYTPTGQAVTSFSVATDRVYRDSADQQKKETTWFRVATWGKMAEACNQYLEKGKLVMVVGRVSTQAWKDNNGDARASLEVVASAVKFLSPHEGNTVLTSDPSAEMPAEDVPF